MSRFMPFRDEAVESQPVSAFLIREILYELFGFALNVASDLSGFRSIIPCGLSGFRMTSISIESGSEVSVDTVREKLSPYLRHALEVPKESVSASASAS